MCVRVLERERERKSTVSAIAGCKTISIMTVGSHFRKLISSTYTRPSSTTSSIYIRSKFSLACHIPYKVILITKKQVYKNRPTGERKRIFLNHHNELATCKDLKYFLIYEISFKRHST